MSCFKPGALHPVATATIRARRAPSHPLFGWSLTSIRRRSKAAMVADRAMAASGMRQDGMRSIPGELHPFRWQDPPEMLMVWHPDSPFGPVPRRDFNVDPAPRNPVPAPVIMARIPDPLIGGGHPSFLDFPVACWRATGSMVTMIMCCRGNSRHPVVAMMVNDGLCQYQSPDADDGTFQTML